MASLDDTGLGPSNKKQRLTVLDAFMVGKNDDFKLVRLTYISRPVRTLEESEKADLLIKAKKRNSDMNVTGILFLAEDLYMQTLEGPRVALMDLLQRLNRDGRHTQLTITSIEFIETRIYPRWSMERVVLSEDSLFIMNNLFNTIVSSFDVLRTYSQQSVIMDWLTNGELRQKSENEDAEEKPVVVEKVQDVVMVIDLVSHGYSFEDELEPRQYFAMVNRFIKVCADVITGYRGQFARYVGDTIIGVFPSEHVENALEAASEIIRHLASVREKASTDFTDPEQLLYAGIGITLGELKAASVEDQPIRFKSEQEKNFMDFFGASLGTKITKRNAFASSTKTPGYDIYEGGALEEAIKLRKATVYYHVPLLMSEKLKDFYVATRKKAQGAQPYREPSGPTAIQSALKVIPTPTPNPNMEPQYPSPLVLHAQQASQPPPSAVFPPNHAVRKEFDISVVGTVRVRSQLFAESGEDTVNVYTPAQFMSDKEPFRTAADRIAEWKKTVEQLRYSRP